MPNRLETAPLPLRQVWGPLESPQGEVQDRAILGMMLVASGGQDRESERGEIKSLVTGSFGLSSRTCGSRFFIILLP